LLLVLAAGCRGEDLTTTPTAVAVSCGNGVVEGSERCDGANLDRASCAVLGFTAGTLTCSDTCNFDTSACESPNCGTDTIETPETCDGSALDGEGCTTQGFTAGTLLCRANCTGFDTTGCTLCGDDVREGSELCDGIDRGGEDCLSQGGDGGVLACNSTCDAFDTNGCFGCGNDRVEGAEVCDGSDHDSEDCSTQGFVGGLLDCSGACDAFVTTGCFRCGNGTVDGNDLCDGNDLDGEECSTQGFTAGTLACNPACDGFVTGDCTECSNNIAETGELCDGTDRAGEDCVSQGAAGGTLACNGTCDGFITTGCFGCGNDLVEGTEVCDGTDLDGEDCSTQGSFTDGTLVCNGNCDGFITTGCTECGNDTVEGAEVCDDTDLDGEDCSSQGFRDGALACNSGCTGFDASACSDEVCTDLWDNDSDGLVDCEDPTTCQGVHPVCMPGAGLPGAACTAHSDCAADNDDPICVREATGAAGGYCAEFCPLVSPVCQSDAVCLDTGLSSGNGVCHDGCVTTADCRAGQLCIFANGANVCVPFCTDDAQCTSLAFCNADTGDCDNDDEICDDSNDNDNDSYIDCDDLDCRGAAGCTHTCPDGDIASALGADLAIGSTAAAVNDNISACAATGAPDVEIAWTAPAGGSYEISTLGSDFDTVLHVLDACAGSTLACNDDYLSPQSQVTVSLAAAQSIIIVVDGFEFASGLYTISITASEAGRCANSLDDDGDGPVDCADPDCARDPACVVCPDSDLASATGAAIATGSTVGAPDDTTPPCEWYGSSDVQLQWTAPTTGLYVFDTAGSDFDTILYVLADDCDGVPLACNDDTASLQTSEITLGFDLGQTVIVVIDGFDTGDEGNWVLNITPQ